MITSSHPPKDPRIFNKEAVSLACSKKEVYLIAPSKEPISAENVKFLNFKPPENRFERFFISSFRIARAAFSVKAKVYHFHEPELLPLGIIIKALTSGKVIYDVHEDYPKSILNKYWIPESIRPVVAKIFDYAERFLSRFVDALVPASEDIKERFQKNEEVILVRNFPPQEWVKSSNNLSKGANLDKSFKLIYTGSLSQTRGIEDIIRSLNHIPSSFCVDLILGGKFSNPEFKTRIETLIDNSPRTKFIGWLPTIQDVMKAYRKADIGLMCFHSDPNLEKGVFRSNKTFQYLAAGLPIIVPNIPAWRDFVSKEKCGISVNTNSPKAIAEGVVYLLENHSLREQMKKNGQRLIKDKYNWENEFKRLDSLYQRLVSQ